MLALSAGIIFFGCAFTKKIPSGVKVNGFDVGGMTYTEASQLVRGKTIEELKGKKLTICGKYRYEFTYPEINFKDNLQKILSSAEKGASYTTEVSYYLNGIKEIVASITEDETVELCEPYAMFNIYGDPFTYFSGNDGIKVDGKKLYNEIKSSLNGGFYEVCVPTSVIKRTKSSYEVKKDTAKLSSFTTYFDGTNSDRSHNIRLAAQFINGRVLRNGESFSFNDTVGERTSSRGFRTAKIIENGEFVAGIGGGVCQVSTTLFNAALLAGCRITEFHPHSLAVSYVPPSFDAMVSGTYYDLKFENRTGYTLYIRAFTGKNSITFNVYGRGTGSKYEYNYVIKESIPCAERTTTNEEEVKSGRDGTVSEGYLSVITNGVKKTTLLRKDKYAPIERVVLEKDEITESGDGNEQ